MNHYVDVFLKEVLGEVRYKKAHPHLAQELNDHIELLKEELMEEGLSEEEAYKRAVKEMGHPADIGKSLHRLHRPKMEWGLLALLIGLIGISFLALASYPVEMTGIDYMKKQVIYSLLGFFIFGLIYFINYQKIERFSGSIYLSGVVIMIIGFAAGLSINGLGAWISIGGFTVKAVNLAIPLFMIGYIGLARKWGNRGIIGYTLLGSAILLATLLCMKSRGVEGAYVATTLIGLSMFYIKRPVFKGNVKKAYLLLGGLVLSMIGGMVYAVLSNAYRVERFWAWVKPEIDPYNKGYLPRVIREIVQSAGLFGNRESIFPTTGGNYLPDGATDFILTFIIGTMGWLVAGLIIVTVGVILIKCFKATNKVKDEYGKMLLYGISIFLSVQYILSVLMNIGISPIGGSIPFLSYGGSKLVCDMALMGFFLGIYRRKDILTCDLLKVDIIEKQDKKVERKNWMTHLAIHILRTSEDIEEVNIRFKERT